MLIDNLIDVLGGSINCSAYEALSDSEKRNIYDRYGEEGLKQHMASGGRGGGGGMNFQDIFSQYVHFFFSNICLFTSSTFFFFFF